MSRQRSAFSPQWILITVPGHPQDRGLEIIEALNERSLAKLNKVLEICPDAWRAKAQWHTSSGGSTCKEPLFIAEAVVRMDWSTALPAHWRAGDRFELGSNGGALQYATSLIRAACVRKALELGVDANGPAGLPPLRAITVKDIRPEKHAKPLSRIVQSYVRAGVDPWATCTLDGAKRDTNLATQLLSEGNLLVAHDLMKHSLDSGKTPPAIFKEDGRIWKAFEKATNLYLEHSTWYTWELNAPMLGEIVKLIAQLQVEPDLPLVERMTRTVLGRSGATSNQPPGLREIGRMTVWAGVCLAMLEAYPEQYALEQHLVTTFSDYSDYLEPEQSSWWKARQLDMETLSIEAPSERRTKMGRRL